MNVNTAAVFGLGKLGLPLACILAEHFRVIGVDSNQARISDLRKGLCPIQEPGLVELLAEVTGVFDLTFTTDGFLATQLSDIVFILVPTPSDPETQVFDPSFVVDCCKTIGAALVPHQTVVVVSTVTPGDMEGVIHDTLVEWSEGEAFELVYAPEFVALGNVLDGLRHPDALLMGVDPDIMAYPQALMDVYCALYSGMDVHIMTWKEAEIAKLSLNCALSTKAAYANTVAELACELDADPYEILGFVGADRRIGGKFLLPGPMPGGTCLPRDLRALQAIMKRNGLDGWPLDFVEAILQAKKSFIQMVVNEVSFQSCSPIGILGLTYKKGTPVVEESFGCELAVALAEKGFRVLVADDEADPWKAEGVERLSERAVIESAQALVLALPKEYYAEAARSHPYEKVVDPWGVLRPGELQAQTHLCSWRSRE